jgi:lauroyl/myristoyl acyltransferase
MSVRLRKIEADRRKYFLREDALLCLELPFLWAVSWMVGERAWKTWCYWIEWIKWRLGFFSTERVAETITKVLPDLAGSDLGRSFALRHAASRSEHHMQILRTYRPGGWNPSLRLEGDENLKRALQDGRGAVLWIAHFSFNALAVKKALAEAGNKVVHLSRPEHGFSKSRFGIWALNPIRVNAELRYLADRIIINRAVPGGAKRAAGELLAANGIVSITAGAWEGRRVASSNLLGGTFELATGAPALADTFGSALLPVYAVRDDDDGVLKVIIDRPIDKVIDHELPERLSKMTQDFVTRMEPYILAYPEQWRDWKSLKFV